jgi:hypothetical protein
MKLEELDSGVDVAATALIGLSMYGFLSMIMIDYNWGTGLTNAFAAVYTATLGRIIPAEDLGPKAALYFVLLLLSFLMLNRRQLLKENLLETLRLGSAIIVLFEVGVFAYVPYFIYKWVIQDLYGTPLQYFTNLDLLLVAAGLLVASQFFLLRTRRQRTA